MRSDKIGNNYNNFINNNFNSNNGDFIKKYQ